MGKNTDAMVVQLLIEHEILDKKEIQACFKEAEKKNSSPIHIIAARSKTPEKKLLEIIAKKLQIECINLKTIEIDANALKKVPVKVSSYYKFVPIRLENRVLTIAVAYPLEVRMLDEIRTHLGFNIEMVLVREEDVLEMLKNYYGLGAETVEKIIAQKTYDSPTEKVKEDVVDDLEALSGAASVIQLVNQIILESYKKRATDIHIEPYRNKVRLRYRIDGVLYESKVSPEVKNFLTPILSRIKLMSNLNIVERRLPQDGRAVVKVQDQTLDLRVSFIPTPYGESVVIRILPAAMLFGLERLGLTESEHECLNELIQKPNGIVFLTGPTGSGKTTTLYACLSCINTDKRKIITIEDPIEYELEGITQIQIAQAVGLDFARGLRSMLRHDPDVMMVGEVRDLETAEIAIRVALTGHLVFSTLHTNDAASGITRLVDIGVEPYLVASSVEAFIAQRLVRMICPACREEDLEIADSIRRQISQDLGYDNSQEIKVFRGKGCQECNFSGYYGRTAIYEILMLNEALRELVLHKSSSDEIKRMAMANGMRTLRQSGWLKVLEGVTTPEEILRVTQADKSVSKKISEKKTSASEIMEIAKETLQKHIAPKKKEFNPADRRVYERLDNRVYVRYTIFKAEKKKNVEGEYEAVQVAVTSNISAGGLLFNAVENLAIGLIIDLTLELPDEGPVQCLSRVVRVEERVPNKDYEIAICFLDLPSSERARLNRFVLRDIKK
ncbi:MAG: ATPase, T2SS/T4P/T4SS family [Candidatus Omnitrophota bacterium]